MKFLLTLKATFVFLLLAVPAAQAAVITLDFEGRDFRHGTVVNNQYNGVTISARNVGGGPDLAVAFNSRRFDTADPDLEGPFYRRSNNARNNARNNPGKILILQENNIGCRDGRCDSPDDEEGRRGRGAGYLAFEFDRAVDILSLDFFDIEYEENAGRAKIRFFDESGEVFRNRYTTPDTGGDNTWDRLTFDGVTGVTKIEVGLFGSGAIDQLVYRNTVVPPVVVPPVVEPPVTPVPEPGSMLLLGVGLLGLGAARRKKTGERKRCSGF